MESAIDEHQPPFVRGRRVKMKYAHAGGYNPPLVIIHGNQVTNMPESYKRYLTNYFRRSLELMGTPIKIEFRAGDNPFSGRRNKLSLLRRPENGLSPARNSILMGVPISSSERRK